MNLISLVVLSLAVFRLSNMVADVNQEGPFGFLSSLRYSIGVRYDEYSHPYGTTSIARGSLCVYCNSVWVGLLAAVAYIIFGEYALMALLPFCLSGSAILLNRLLEA